MPTISKSELIRLVKTLGTDVAVAAKLNKSPQYVFRLRYEYDIPSSRAGNIKRNEKIVALYKKGTSGLKIAEMVGLTSPMVYNILKKTGASMRARGIVPKGKKKGPEIKKAVAPKIKLVIKVGGRPKKK